MTPTERRAIRILELEAALARLEWAKTNRALFSQIGDSLWRGFASYDEAIDAAMKGK